MTNFVVCRVCLGFDIKSYAIGSTQLQEIFEDLTKTKLYEDGRPNTVCYICLAMLQRCHRFVDMSQHTEAILTKMLHSNFELTEETVSLHKNENTNNLHTTPVQTYFISCHEENIEDSEANVSKADEEEEIEGVLEYKKDGSIDESVGENANKNLQIYTKSENLRKRKKYDTSITQRQHAKKTKYREKCFVKECCRDTCLKKCMEKFSEDERKEINETYWSMSWKKRRIFIQQSSYVGTPKRKIKRSPKRRPKRTFFFKNNDENIVEVCKIFFLSTLGYKPTNDNVLYNTLNNEDYNNLEDRRGKHIKTMIYDRDSITQHIESFHPTKSHYRKEYTPLRKYLPSDINVKMMHEDFLEKHPQMQISYELYRKHLKSLNISFARLGNEESEICEAIEEKIEECEASESKADEDKEIEGVQENEQDESIDESEGENANENLQLNNKSENLRKIKKYDTSITQIQQAKKTKHREKFIVKEGCSSKCLKKCMEQFTEEERKEINGTYWSMSWKKRRIFIQHSSYAGTPKRKITRSPKRRPKRTFFFKNNVENIVEVCKIFFLSTLGYKPTNDNVLYNTLNNEDFNNLEDRRGKHIKTMIYDRDSITRHIESFHPTKSHYRKEHTPLRKYLQSDINVKMMHKDFLEKHPQMQISYEWYRKHLKSLNI